MYRALDVARYIIKRCHMQQKSISNLKLQKILYFVQAEFLVTTGRKCFSDAIEAWDFGPVVPEVYHHYKAYGIIDECSKYSASALVQITHNQAPWKNNYERGWNNEIPCDEIKEYFEED